MTLRLMVTCDSNPAPYAGSNPSTPCRAWLTVPTIEPHSALLAALRDGWAYEYHVEDGNLTVDRTTCPACVRALDANAPPTAPPGDRP